MKNETLYNKTVNILVQAYFNDTLISGSCSKCAVGNIINHYKPFTYQQEADLSWQTGGWSTVFMTIGDWQYFRIENYVGEAKAQIDVTGYSPYELSKIEYAFEIVNRNSLLDEDAMFNGLMAVIDVLDEIHENKDAAVTNSTKKKFQKA